METRIIKFRAWYARENKMFNVDVLAISECSWGCPDFGKHGVSLAYQSHIEVMQYTGLQDKNGQECYHKDILRSGKKLFIVEWQNEEARFLLLPTGSNTDTWKFMDEIDHMEIIGNIYETPTLAQRY